MRHVAYVASAGLILGVASLLGCATSPDGQQSHRYSPNTSFKQQMSMCQTRGIVFTDYHIHIRGGMTPEKAIDRQQHSGIRSAVLENYGREWPLSDNAKLAAFIATCKQAAPTGISLPIGIQVNDRDWYQTIDPALLKKLDFILADTMIMGVTKEGSPQRLWLPEVNIQDAKIWMQTYLSHNLRILDEPISILANPTYLPPCISNRYDELWSETNMRQIIEKAVKNNIALEIQAGSPYPNPAFLKLAKAMGAKFSFGTNNFDPKPKDLSRWFEAITLLDLHAEDLWTPSNCKKRP